VESDPTHLRRIVRNYLSNAVEHARARRILAGVRRRGRMVRIIIADDGRGVPEASREAIFEDFARVVREGEPAAAGIGLGLAVVRRSARLLGHAYGVISRPGCGSQFWVEAPLCRAPSAVDSIVRSRRTVGLRVLVIEDSAPTAHGLSLLLGAFGHDVRYAHGVEEAVSVVGAWRPDAILADYRLKGEETGLDAIEAIRRTLAADLPAIIITGEGSPQVMAAIDRIGAPVLHKPVAPTVLRAALEHIAAPD
jgi:CheY-like chemotaxis protein